MKTYIKSITAPRLVITYDNDAQNPRDDDGCIGYFMTAEDHRQSPDQDVDLERIVRNCGQMAESLEEHIKEVTRAIEEERDEKVLAIYPVYRYEHGGVMYKRGTASGFDYSNCGLYIITDKTADGVEEKDFIRIVDAEIATYTQWVNGEVYGYTLYSESGQFEDSCWGFYSIEDIRESLPEEWKDEDLTQYQSFN